MEGHIMARISRPMANLLTDLMARVLDFSAQLHPENTKREQQLIERRIHKHLETIVEYLAVIHDEELPQNQLEENRDVNS
jgi:hypothetical protein